MKKNNYYYLLIITIMIVLSSFASADLDDGLKNVFKFSNTSVFNSITKTTGTTNSDYTASGKDGGALDYEASNADYSTSTSANIDINNVYTISVWVKFESFAFSTAGTIYQGDDSTNRYGGYNMNSPTAYSFAGHSTDNLQINIPASNTTGEWINFVFICGPGYAREVWINGVNQSFATKIILNNCDYDTGRLWGKRDTNQYYADGVIDEWYAWNRTLTPSEIQELQTKFYNDTQESFYISDPFKIYGYNYWNSSLIPFNATINETLNYGSATGIITTSLSKNNTDLFNISAYKPINYYNQTFINQDITTNLDIYFYQNIVNISPKELITNDDISNFTVKVNGTTKCTTTGSWCLIYPNKGSYTVTITDNTGAETYHTTNNTLVVDYIENITFNPYVHGHELFIRAKKANNNATINNFNATIISYDGSYTETKSTSTGVINFDVIHDTYNYSVLAVNYSITDNNGSITITSAQRNYTRYVYLYTQNSYSILFKDARTKEIINTSTISLEIISDLYSNNYSTSNGTLYIDLLTPTTYTFRYKGLPVYPERFYVTTLVDKTHTSLILYLLNSSGGNDENITINIVDDKNDPLLNSFVEVLRYDINTNSYLLQEILEVNIEGKAYFTGELNTEYYKFIVEHPFGTVVYVSEPQYLRSSTITLRVNINTQYADNYFKRLKIYGDLIFNETTNNFKLTYSDSLNNMDGACVYVYNINYDTKTLQNTSCAYTPAGTILINVANITGRNYLAQAFAILDGEEYYITELYQDFKQQLSDSSKKYRLWLVMIITILLVMLLITVDKTVTIIALPIPLFFASITGFIEFSKEISLGFLLGSIALAYYINRKG